MPRSSFARHEIATREWSRPSVHYNPGNGAKRCRDRTEIGFERYLCLAILGRNLHVLGKMLIARQSPDSLAGTKQTQSGSLVN